MAVAEAVVTERQLELREYRRERKMAQESRITRHEDAPPPPQCRVLMRGGKWLVPKSERPAIRIPNERLPEAAERGPDYRHHLVAAKSGSKVVRV